MTIKIPNRTKKIIKKLLGPLYYSYIGYQVYSFIQKLSGYKKEKKRIFKSLGYYPNLKNPCSFNEKVLWKKIYDRNPLLPVVTDKYRVREYLKNVLGEKETEKILTPIFYVTVNPDSIPFDTLSEEYIIKPNHEAHKYVISEITEKERKYTIKNGSSQFILSDCDKTKEEIINICKNWLLFPHGFNKLEWAYQKVKRNIIIEKLLRDSHGRIPLDYKFNIFHGKCHLIQVYSDRLTNLNRAWYTPSWNYIEIKGSNIGPYNEKPEKLDYMIEIAEFLGKPFDFIRVDLYLIDNHVYFGELTNYPNSGTAPFNPASLDFEFGLKWRLIPGYWT